MRRATDGGKVQDRHPDRDDKTGTKDEKTIFNNCSRLDQASIIRMVAE